MVWCAALGRVEEKQGEGSALDPLEAGPPDLHE